MQGSHPVQSENQFPEQRTVASESHDAMNEMLSVHCCMFTVLMAVTSVADIDVLLASIPATYCSSISSSIA